MIAAALLLLAAAPAAAPAAAGETPLGPPRLAPGGTIVWSVDAPRTVSPAARLERLHAADADAPGEPAGEGFLPGAVSRETMFARLADPLVRAAAIRAFVPRILAAADTARADTLLAALARLPGPWGWETVRQRASLALARQDTAAADRLLEAADREGWTDPERAAWLALRVRLRAALGDTATAVTFARQGVRRYPATSAAGEMLALLSRMLARANLAAEDERAAAEVEFWRGDRPAAAARLARAFAAWPAAEGRARVGLRHAELLRLLGRLPAARSALDGALAAATDASDSARVLLERARVEKDAGRRERAAEAYAAAVAAAPDDAGRERALWERARDLEREGAWAEARRLYAAVAGLGSRRVEEARLRAALTSLALEEPRAALAWCEGGTSDAALFWRGVLLRRKGRPDAVRVLETLASRPGYSFYRSAARETLGVPSPRPARVAEAVPPASGVLAAASLLLDLGLPDEATGLLERWAAGDPRIPDSTARAARLQAVLAAAQVAFRAGRYRPAIRLATRAFEAQADTGDSARWSMVPWLYPPAYDTLFAAYPETASTAAGERALLQAVAWKESHFDARARSRSNALGLLQLMRPAVIDVAGWLGERVPSESAVLDPAVSLRYGARYLAHQLRRLEGDLPLALAAYNAGPSVARRWVRLRELGGDALACEEIDLPETQDYVKTILGVRQAYRELRPASSGGW